MRKQTFKPTKNELESIILNHTFNDICTHFHTSRATILKLMKEYGIEGVGRGGKIALKKEARKIRNIIKEEHIGETAEHHPTAVQRQEFSAIFPKSRPKKMQKDYDAYSRRPRQEFLMIERRYRRMEEALGCKV